MCVCVAKQHTIHEQSKHITYKDNHQRTTNHTMTQLALIESKLLLFSNLQLASFITLGKQPTVQSVNLRVTARNYVNINRRMRQSTGHKDCHTVPQKLTLGREKGSERQPSTPQGNLTLLRSFLTQDYTVRKTQSLSLSHKRACSLLDQDM